MENNEKLDQIPEGNEKDNRDENIESIEITEVTDKADPEDADQVDPDILHEELTEDPSGSSDFEKVIETPEESTEIVDPAPAVQENIIEEVPEHAEKDVPEPVSVEASAVNTDLALNMTEQIEQAQTEAESEAEEADDLPEAEINYNELSKEELLQMLEAAVNVDDISTTKNRISQIKVEFLKKIKEDKQEQFKKFISDGGHEEDYKPLPDPAEERFQQIFEIYRTKKSIFNEQQEQLKLKNLAAKHKILEDLKVLVNSDETLKKTYDEFRTLQDQWKEIGQVPRGEVNDLWQNYHFLVEKFFDKVKINKELKDLDLKKNLEQKMQLCEKAEELLLSPSIHKSFKQLQKYHDEWKAIGPVPQDKKEEVWERFKTVSDRINLNRRDYYNQLQEEQENNLLTKSALCVRLEDLLAEEINGLSAWRTKTTEIDELVKLWQDTGRAPVKENDEIWQRFKKGVNYFYATKKEYFNGLKDQQTTNYNLKLNLCLQAEALVTSTNWKNTHNEYLRLQDEWKSIGPVPRKYSDKVWKRFRDACNAFYAAKANYFSNINQIEAENLNKKLELIKQIEEYPVADEKNANLEALRNFQREWMEIGHVPINQKDKLQTDFRAAINHLLDRLKISTVEAGTIDYKNRLESLKTDPEAGKIIYRERNLLEGKISKLQADINLWENNIGFLAKSKNADILKQEFEKKINGAKEELLLLKAKLKLLAHSGQK